ncbi:MAG TPA: fimbrial protein [Scandinavium sp.]|uniref:fimbrial protein n=1 Tax=Scandinavium sp. TaxID=2830653 RepID=UPI002E32E61D|nr:fimbrial protein [Scandinavium sp.]HEX4502925.1 fimbrial protein [Scandinavium sp.]
MNKILLTACFVIICIISSTKANAMEIHCKGSGGNYSASGNFTVPGGAAVGYISPKINATGSNWALICGQDTTADRDIYVKFQTATPAVTGYSQNYPTNLHGWSVHYNFSMSNPCANSPGLQNDSPLTNQMLSWTCHMMHGTDTALNAGSVSSTLQFVKTADDAESGIITTIPVVTTSVTYNNQSTGTDTLTNIWGGAISVTVINPSCAVNTSTVNVPVGDYLTTEFTAINHTTENKNIPISINCSSSARINALITANSDSSTSQQGAIKLNSGGASGIAIQLLDKNGAGVALNKKFVVDTTPGAGEYDFNWQVRYLQTAATVSPGDASASATLTLNYD